MLKSTSMVHNKLKKELSNKFNKNTRKDEFNQSTVVSRRKSSVSLMINNPLTKSSYSMNDTITHKSNLKDVVSSKKGFKSFMGSRQKITSSYRERYNSSIDSPFFQTRADEIERSPTTPRMKPSLSAREVISRKSSVEHNFRSQAEARQNKFKLLFR